VVEEVTNDNVVAQDNVLQKVWNTIQTSHGRQKIPLTG